jgi:hypothetical protein
MPIDFAQNGVATHLCGGNHAIDAFDVVETYYKVCAMTASMVRPADARSLSTRLMAFWSRAAQALASSSSSKESRRQAASKSAPAPYTPWRS